MTEKVARRVRRKDLFGAWEGKMILPTDEEWRAMDKEIEDEIVNGPIFAAERAETAAKGLAYYDDRFFAQWPAITENSFGVGVCCTRGLGCRMSCSGDGGAGAGGEWGYAGGEWVAGGCAGEERGEWQGLGVHYLLNFSGEAVTFKSPFAGRS